MKIFEIKKGTTFRIDCEKDSTLSSIPVKLSEDLHGPDDAVLFAKCECESCDRSIAVIGISEYTDLVFDADDLHIPPLNDFARR